MNRQIAMRAALRAMIRLPRVIRDEVTGVFVSDSGDAAWISLPTDQTEEVAAAVQALPGARPSPWNRRPDGMEQASISVELAPRVHLSAHRVRAAQRAQEAA